MKLFLLSSSGSDLIPSVDEFAVSVGQFEGGQWTDQLLRAQGPRSEWSVYDVIWHPLSSKTILRLSVFGPKKQRHLITLILS